MSKPSTPKAMLPARSFSRTSLSRISIFAISICVIAVIAAATLLAARPARSSRHANVAATAQSKPQSITPAARARINASYAALPLAFEENQGQTDPQVKYMARGNGYTLFLTSGDAVLSLVSRSSSTASRPKRMMEQRTVGYSLKARKAVRPARSQAAHTTPSSVAALRMHVFGGNSAAQPEGSQLLSSKTNYFIGNDSSKWHKGVAQYARVSYPDVYPGVTLTYHGNDSQLEFDFVVAPGANPVPISMSFSGANRIRTNSSGDLELVSSAGNLKLHKPVAYQEQNGVRQPVDANFILQADKVSFKLGDYDRSRELVIDPTLSYASYLGGNGDDEGYGIAVDSNGNSYIAGESNSTSGFPGGDPSHGGFDAFVVKINADGNRGYTTFVGGSGDDLGAAIAVDASNAVYVSGITTSTNFPTSSGAPQTTSGSSGSCTTGNGTGTCTDSFLFKLDSTGASTYSTYLGGNNDDGAFGVAVDGSGNAYVTGFTFSSNFPLHNAAYSVLNNNIASNPPFEDAFVTEINAAGTAWVYSTYLGGQDNDFGNGIAVNSGGDAFVVGATSSIDFPATVGAFQTICGTDGNCNAGVGTIFTDAFVTEIPAGGGHLTGPVYSTYLGGSSDDFGLAIALDGSGNAYVTGQTTDDNLAVATGDFPFLGGFQQNYGGGSGNANAGGNAFVTKLNSAGHALVYSSYLGGSTSDVGFGIAVDASNHAYLTGSTLSSDFPAGGGFQTARSGNSDAFVTEVAANGTSLVYSSYLGGTGDENFDATAATFIGGAVALDSSASAHLAGTTSSSSGFPITSGTVIQSSYGGAPFDAFAATVLSPTAPDFSLSASAPAAVSPGSSASSTVTLTALNSYNLAVNLACSVSGGGSPAPACSASSFSPNPQTPTSAGATSALTITTTGATAAVRRPSGVFYAAWLPVVGLSLLGMGFSAAGSRRKKLLGFLLVGMVVAALFFLPSCGGSSGGGGGGGGGGGCTGCTPAGTYTITITGTDANNLSRSTAVTLTVN